MKTKESFRSLYPLLALIMLPDLGSNQGSSPPKGDVLPVTPSGNLRLLFSKMERKDKIFMCQTVKSVV